MLQNFVYNCDQLLASIAPILPHGSIDARVMGIAVSKAMLRSACHLPVKEGIDALRRWMCVQKKYIAAT